LRRRPPCQCFGGEHLDVLFVTSASDRRLTGEAGTNVYGRLIALDVGIRGLPEPVFGG
jgi:sugar lactone lactonase YvrE